MLTCALDFSLYANSLVSIRLSLTGFLVELSLSHFRTNRQQNQRLAKKNVKRFSDLNSVQNCRYSTMGNQNWIIFGWFSWACVQNVCMFVCLYLCLGVYHSQTFTLIHFVCFRNQFQKQPYCLLSFLLHISSPYFFRFLSGNLALPKQKIIYTCRKCVHVSIIVTTIFPNRTFAHRNRLP